jgi:hypothetical protein
LAGIEIRNNKRPEIVRTEKTIPAIAAARGVFKRALIKSASCFIKLPPRNILSDCFIRSGIVFEAQEEEDKAAAPKLRFRGRGRLVRERIKE